MQPKIIAGVDEVGIGPLAGPIIAAAVILNPAKKIYKLDDSKLLSAKQREHLFHRIYERALAVSIGRVEVEDIDKLNIYHANMLAMERAITGLSIVPELILIDGRAAPKLNLHIKTIVHGDRLEKVISAASIIAKVTRDSEMKKLDELYPQYQFAKHKGYATKTHRAMLQQYGPSPVHRRSFAFVKLVTESI
jgi:ribonuclease HII